jgi:hypothetical protein
MTELEGRITISRTTSNKSKDYISISFDDATSGCKLIRATMTLEDFAAAVTGLACSPATYEIYREACDKAGWVRETKRVLLPRLGITERSSKEDIDEILSPHEVDGWKGRAQDLFNSHNWRNGDSVLVTFTRFVEKVEG